MSSAVRRNGLLSSCEPCRKSKLRCDHALPCSRCRRRRKPALCVYHPAPMTRLLDNDAAEDHPSCSSLSEVKSSGSTDFTSPPSRSWTGPLQNQNQNKSQHGEQPVGAAASGPLRDRYIADWSKRAALFPNAGVLGPTSYSAVFSESDDVARSSNVTGSLRDLSKSLRNNLHAIDDGQIQLGAELLLILYDDFTLYAQMATTNFDQCEGYIFAAPVLKPIFDSVWRMLEDAIEDRSDPLPSLRKLSKSIFENSSQPVGVDSQTTPEEFFGSMPRKWEIIGLMFSVVGSSACLLPQSDLAEHGAASLDRRGLGVVCVSAGDICLRFCDNSGVISEQLAWVLLAHTSLLTFLYGDHDYRPWKTLGDLGTVVFALGFHQQEAFARLPLFLSEHRKRLVVGSYALDKELATFLGRPPRLSWRHLDIEPPLDVDFCDIMAAPHVREAALAKVDSEGWNTEATISNITYARVIHKMGPVRELVLEVSLNPRIYNDLEQRISEISAMSKQIRNQLPPTLCWDREHLEGLDQDREKGYVTLGTHLNFLHCEFTLQRTLVKRKGSGSEALLNIAHEMLSVLLIAISNRSRDGRDNNTMAWTMSIFGLPSAGVLAIELLRQSQTPDPNPLFPRSEVIQNLSRFAADLEYVIWPHAGNYEICQQARKVLRHILDRVLSAPPAVPAAASSSSAAEIDFAPMDWLTSDDASTWFNQDSDFMKWVDSFDWGQELGR